MSQGRREMFLGKLANISGWQGNVQRHTVKCSSADREFPWTGREMSQYGQEMPQRRLEMSLGKQAKSGVGREMSWGYTGKCPNVEEIPQGRQRNMPA